MIARIVEARPLAGVRAGSALLALGDRLLVVGDDAHAVTWVTPATGEVRQQVLAGDGAALPKPLKPDLEAAFVDDSGVAWLLGSGSLPNRRRIYRLAGGDHAEVTSYDGEALHAALAAHLDEPPNVEGALHVGGVVRLFHRSTGARPDVVLDVPPQALVGDRAEVLGVRTVAPPRVAGVPAHVTDAALSADGRVALLAAAEDTADAVADGPVAGTLLGFLDGEWGPILHVSGAPSLRKAEGLVLDARGAGGWLVTDRDDPAEPAELCRFALEEAA